MECFNCNKPAVKKLVIEPEIGEINLCENPKCREKAVNDIERFQYAKNHQGRRKDQVDFHEKVAAYALIGAITVVVILVLIKYAQIL